MKKRSKIPMKKSKKMFSATAEKTHPKNYQGQSISVTTNPMRGGIRL